MSEETEAAKAASILSDITVFMKYAKYNETLGRRETWDEIVTRNKEMHQKKYPELKLEIERVYKLVYDKKILPSMRSLQFGGKPIEISPNRVYNCAFIPIDDWRAFGETLFLLLGGTGVGYSVQKHHTEKLPEIRKPRKDRTKRFLISDSIERKTVNNFRLLKLTTLSVILRMRFLLAVSVVLLLYLYFLLTTKR